MNICILPAGAWGTALAIHLSRNGHSVTLVPHTLEEAMDMGSCRENKRFFPGHPLPSDLQIGFEIKPALMEADVCILACPSKFLRSVCQNVRSQLGEAKSLKLFITICKGLEEGTNDIPSTILEKELPGYFHGVLSGPTFASQVAEGQPSALVLATNASDELKLALQEAISGENLRVYTSTDMVGVELGGCLKNVYAIASGMCDGLGLRDNSRAALLTRALHEMVRVGVALGGSIETFYGLTGFGDLVLTCNGEESRNRTFGELYAKGESIKSLIEEKQMTVEGYRTSHCFHHICVEKGIDAPILEQIYRILYEGQTAGEAIRALMSRELKSEH
ncbi:NAD(P)-dependent glycerol-3-phosphate dehydrogenase [Puniceicoccales bacterium CK1056]|uniref:Glycerol-3-phosphate dehydrogenase [NAD(P)+] n=1 Tax=Oceanipulchritudo coccoides TaxID=2706888 RepID=A0A6B2M204_9BACT|nr:NAD(P)H-dependent glycerol-3-phosphate dehydrogenase [Oceanipulchritudo coccoides]NDV61825.1 NAD(P)-dependent glycerol-3-phosphate dehydrogenase [Oceanipulchritudo coccoides]